MLIITYKVTIICCRECGFSGSRQSEEEADVVGISFADVATGVERKMSLFGHKVVHYGEHSLFHLTCVLAAQNHHLSLLEVETHCDITQNVRDVFVGHELTCVENVVICTIREIFLEFSWGWFNEHIGHKECMVGTSAHNPNLNPIFGAPSCIPINNINFSPCVEVTFGQSSQNLEGVSSNRFVDVSPSNFILTDGVIHNGFGSW